MDDAHSSAIPEKRNWAAEVEQLKEDEEDSESPNQGNSAGEESEEGEWREEAPHSPEAEEEEGLPQVLEQLQLHPGAGDGGQAAAEEQQKLQEYFSSSFKKSATPDSLHHTEAAVSQSDEDVSVKEPFPVPTSAKVSPPIQVAAVLPTIGELKKTAPVLQQPSSFHKAMNSSSHLANLGLKLPLQPQPSSSHLKYPRHAPASTLVGNSHGQANKPFLSQNVPSSNYCSNQTSYAKTHLEYPPTIIQAALPPPQRYQHPQLLRDQHYVISSSPKDQALRHDMQIGSHAYGHTPESPMAHHLGYPESMSHFAAHLQSSPARMVPTYVPSNPQSSYGPAAYGPYLPATAYRSATPNYRHPGEAAAEYGYNSVMGSSHQTFKMVDPRLVGSLPPPPPLLNSSTNLTVAQLYQQYNMNLNILNNWYSRSLATINLQLKEGIGTMNDRSAEASQNKAATPLDGLNPQPIYLHNVLSYAQQHPPPPPMALNPHYVGQEYVRSQGMPEFISAADPRAYIVSQPQVKMMKEKLPAANRLLVHDISSPLLPPPTLPNQNFYSQPLKEAKLTASQSAAAAAAELAIAKALHKTPESDKMVGVANLTPIHKPGVEEVVHINSNNETARSSYVNSSTSNHVWSSKDSPGQFNHHHKNQKGGDDDRSAGRGSGGSQRRGTGGNFQRNATRGGYNHRAAPQNSDPRFRERVYQRKEQPQYNSKVGSSRNEERLPPEDKT